MMGKQEVQILLVFQYLLFFLEEELRILEIHQNQEAYKSLHYFFVHIVLLADR